MGTRGHWPGSNKEAFERLFDKGPDCWVWKGFVQENGYGQWNRTTAHRAAYRIYVGPIPEGHVVDHLCHNKLCVRPDHLEAVTQAENVERG